MSKRSERKKKRKEAAQAAKNLKSSGSTSTSGNLSSKSSSGNSEWGTNWWVKDYGKKKIGTAVSSYWTSKIDESWYGWNYGSYVSKRGGTDFGGIISSIRRSANIVSNSEGSASEELELKVKWATEEHNRNTTKGQEVFLSPSVVDSDYTRKPEWTNDERIDVLIGEALVQSTMKRTIDSKVEERMLEESKTKKGSLSNEIWTVAEHLFAEKDVLENYPGFKGYFAANRAYYTGTNTKRSFENNLKLAHESGKLDPAKASASLVWELLHPGEPLENVPPDLRKFVEWCKERLSSESSSEGRAKAACEIAAKAYELFQVRNDDGMSTLDGGSNQIGMEIPEIGLSELSRGDEIDHRTSDPIDDDPRECSKRDCHSVPQTLEGVDWHGSTIDFKVNENPLQYSKIVSKLTPIIKDVRNRLKIRAEEQKMIEHALKKGRLDEGSLYKLGFSKFDYKDEKIFEQEEIISMPKVAFGLLVDESGSMGTPTGRHGPDTRIHAARDVAIILAEALNGLEGVRLGVWGHTAEGYYQGGTGSYTELCIHQYYTPEHPKMSSIANMDAFSNNLDGYAIAYVTRQMVKFFPECETKVLIHVSDGQPAGRDYGGIDAQDHMGGIVKLSKMSGVQVIGIGIANAFSQSTGNRMYGPGNFVILNGLVGFQNIVSNIVTKIASSKR